MTEPRTLPLEKENFCLRLLCCYMLYERKRDTQLKAMAEGLITERHLNWHKEHGDDWRLCKNQVCINARLIVDEAKAMEVDLNQFAVELMTRYTVNFRPVVQEGKLLQLHAKLVEIGELVKTAEAAAQAKEGVILP